MRQEWLRVIEARNAELAACRDRIAQLEAELAAVRNNQHTSNL